MTAFAVQNPLPTLTGLDGLPLTGGYVYFGVENGDPIASPVSVYYDAAMTIPARQPLRTNAGFVMRNGAPASLYASGAFSVLVKDAKNREVMYVPSGTGADPALRADLAAPGGLSVVGFIQAGTAAQARNAQDKMHEAEVTPFDFMTAAQIADVQGNVGALDVTTPLLNFFNECISSGRRGKIRAGTYTVSRGVLAFDNAFTDAAWPEIDTEGHLSVIFSTSDAASAPILSITNGTAGSAVGKYWRGGKLGGITFKDTSGSVATDRHGLLLRGMWGTRFGWMRSDSLPGDAVHIENKMFGGTNPDPYAVAFCSFEGIEANSCKGWAVNNANQLGFNFNEVRSLRAVGAGLGGWFGFGAGNYLDHASMGSISGWAFDDGTAAVTGVTPGRLNVRAAELDNVEKGIRCNHVRQFAFENVRFIHRYQTAPNASANYYPRVAIRVCDGTSPAVTDGYANVQHRIEAGGLKADLGTFFDGSSSTGVTNVAIDQRIVDNAGFGFVDGDLYTGVNTNAKDLTLKKDGKLIIDQSVKAYAVVTSSAAQTVPNTGFSGAGAKITFPSLRAGTDRDGNYSTADSDYTIPYTGAYRVAGIIHLAVAAGTRVRFGFWRDRSGSLAAVAIATRYAATANAEGYTISGVFDFVKGDKVAFYADQNTAGAVNLASSFSTAAENQWSIEAL